MAIINDALSLQYSASFNLQGMQEENVNLNLTPSSNSKTTLIGTVTDGTNPVADATVKVFDSKGAPFAHTLTGKEGGYLFEGLPAGTYSVAVAHTGYRMSPFQGVTLTPDATITADVVISADDTLDLGAAAGIVTTVNKEGKTVKLGDIKLTLFDNKMVQVATTYSTDDGEFAFYDLADGEYKVIGTANGYLESAPMSFVIRNGSIANMQIRMIVDGRVYNGTVNGVITSTGGNPVAGCFVGLYQVATDTDGQQVETLVAITKTNAGGQYLFGNVVAGNYIVKAKQHA